MKNLFFISLLLTIILISCDKNNTSTWSEEDKAYHQEVMILQEQAVENYTSWLQTMDSIEAIQQLQAFFLDDSTVISAEIGRQGIAVQYTNGMRGGIFIDPNDEFEIDTTDLNLLPKISNSEANEKALVNNKKAILLNPSYWQRSTYTNSLIGYYNQILPKVEYNFTNIYKGMDANVDRFTQLKGFGFIHVYTHGWAWPQEWAITDVYVMTGEKASEVTSGKYWDDIVNGNIIIGQAKTSINTFDNVYWLSENFVASHNDFSKDTVLFYGGFCNSFLGNWPEIVSSFANGTYFGFSWRVNTVWNYMTARDLLGRMTDTSKTVPISTENWYTGPYLGTKQWDQQDQLFCLTQYSGDATLTLWKGLARVETSPVSNIGETSATCGGNVVNDGGSPITARGVCWSEDPQPTISDSHTSDGVGIGAFISSLTGLKGDTPYYVRAYAINANETFYGNQLSFTTTGGELYIGKPYQGGMIFYLDGEHGLILDTMGHAQGSMSWGCMGVLIGNTSTAIGSGMQNTEFIVTGCSELETPARFCYDLEFYGYTDWFLPSKDELNELYLQQDVLGIDMYSIHVSSSEIDADNCWAQDMGTGQQFPLSKIPAHGYYIIRAF